ncbi:MAG: hypothetical protein JNL74_15245 [Fibrobacteres bacterium]|nr:hypothetical protein [Fibrobacterota bacterium]
MKPFFIIFAMLIIANQIYPHAHWVQPLPRAGENIKVGPCGGKLPGIPADTVFTGDTLTVKWNEYINHNGYYIVSYSTRPDSNFKEILRATDTAVNGTWTRKIVFPDSVTGKVSLQVIQAMVTTTSTTYYYSCTDVLVLSKPTTSETSTISQPASLRILSANPHEPGTPLILAASKGKIEKVVIYEISGKIVYSTSVSSASSSGSVSVALPNSLTGIKLISVTIDGKKSTKPLIFR